MENKLLTQKDLAQRWQMSVKSIEEYRKAGIIPVVEGIPAIRFNIQTILELEGTKLERFSPIERRNMERELEKLKQENEQLKGILSKTLANLAPVLSLKEDRP
ncbi:histidine kinase [Clostridium botulinum C/D str. BKT12695]|nr:histidine kinase [Clostridium botulinum C/D str. BKT12695]